MISFLFPLLAYSRTFGGLSILLWFFAPVFGTWAFVRARRELRRLRANSPSPHESRNTRLVAVMGASGTLIWLCVAGLVVLFSLFAPVDVESRRDHIINGLNNLAAHAHRHRTSPLSAGGGGGTYNGYHIPRAIYVPSEEFYYLDTTGGFSYRVIHISPDSIILEGRCEGYREGMIQVTIDSAGRPTDWRYYGGLVD
jgi:hypothetical protein